MEERQRDINAILVKTRDHLNNELGVKAASKITDAKIIANDYNYGFEYGIQVNPLK